MADLCTATDALPLIWQVLAGGTERGNPCNLPGIATRQDDHCRIRTVVLRDVNETARRLVFFTDVRSPKISQISLNPTISWLFYHPEKRLQVGAMTHAQIHHGDDLAARYWQPLEGPTLAAYQTVLPPGTPVDSADGHVAAETPKDSCFDNFAAVVCSVYELELLELLANGNRRRRLCWEGEHWSGQWLVP